MTGLKLSGETLKNLFVIDKKSWQEELEEIKKFFMRFGKKLPKELWQEYDALTLRLKTKTQANNPRGRFSITP